MLVIPYDCLKLHIVRVIMFISMLDLVDYAEAVSREWQSIYRQFSNIRCT